MDKAMNILLSAFKNRLIQLTVILMAGLLPYTGQARFTAPPEARISGSNQIIDNQGNTVRITWSGTSDSVHTNDPGQTYRVVSGEGAFLSGRNLLGINNRHISERLTSGAVNPFTITETLRIPRSVIAAAEQAGTSIIQYRRIFTDEFDGAQSSSTAELKIVSGSSGVLSISRIDLRFNNGGTSMVVETGRPLNATANFKYNGSGLLDLSWEIATPPGTNGTPVFKTLKTLRRFLGAGRSLVIESPNLPSQQSGRYILRLTVNSPEVNFAPSFLHYSVVRGTHPEQAMQTIRLISPHDNQSINESTPFAWNPVANATQYQLEIYRYQPAHPPGDNDLVEQSGEAETKQLTTGILLPSNTLQSALTPLTLTHLEEGKAYYWRTVAVDANGLLVGKTEFRKIIFSP